MQMYRLILLLIVMVIFNACTTTVQPDKAAAEVKKIITAEQPSPPKVWSTAANTSSVQIHWIKSFNDPTLEKLIQLAQTNNINLRSAAANVARAQALAVQAGAALKPNANLAFSNIASGSGNNNSTITTKNLSVQLNWEIDLWGRIAAGTEAALLNVQAEQADYRYAQHSLAAATAKAYVSAIEAKLQTNVIQEKLSILKETLRIVNVQYENGLVSSQDLSVTRSDLASANEQLEKIKGSERDGIRALEILLGRYPSAELDIMQSLPYLPPLPPAGIPSTLLERRPDIIAVERRVAAAFHKVLEKKAARLPSLSLTSSIGGTSNALSTLLNPSNLAWQLGANLLAPIVDGGNRQAQIDIATIEQQQVLASYAQTALNAFSEVETFLDQGSVLNKQMIAANTALDEINNAYRIAKLRHQEGEISLLDILNIQQRITSLKSNVVSLTSQQLIQRVNLHLALGGNW